MVNTRFVNKTVHILMKIIATVDFCTVNGGKYSKLHICNNVTFSRLMLLRDEHDKIAKCKFMNKNIRGVKINLLFIILID